MEHKTEARGWIIMASEDHILNSRLGWGPNDGWEYAYVHTAIESIRAMSAGWDPKPTKKIPAMWSPETGVVVLGEAVDF